MDQFNKVLTIVFSEKKPVYGLILLTLVGIVLRILYVLSVDRIHFPDELFQAYEQALRITKGYGIIPWEYQYGARSWLLPGFIAFILKIAFLLGLDTPGEYLLFTRIVLSLFSLLLIPTAYYISKSFFRSQRTAFLTAFGVAVWYELVYFASRPLSEVFVTHILFACLALLLYAKKYWQYFIAGALGGLTVVLRYHYVFAFLGILFVWWYRLKNKNKQALIWIGTGMIVLLMVGGYIDKLTWGSWFHSIRTHMLLHFQYDIGSAFGTKTWWWYIYTLTIASAGLWLFSIRTKNKHYLAPCILLLIVYSAVSHKEYRYAFFTIPYLLVLALPGFDSIISKWTRSKSIAPSLTILSVVSLLGYLGKIPYSGNVYSPPPNASSSLLKAYTAISKQSDVCGVFDATHTWVLGAGYTYLGTNVPLYNSDNYPKSELNVNYLIVTSQQMKKQQLAGYTPVSTYGLLHVLRREGKCSADPSYTYNRYFEDVEQELHKVFTKK